MDKSKVCDSCGKCLGEEDFETRSVMVDEIIDDEEYFDEEGEQLESVLPESEDEDGAFQLIDDVEGLRELLENKEHKEKYTVEEFPGFIRFKTKEEP